jgi:outer membrane protein assembly factor BamD (BamD/ComL family)
MDLGNGSPIGRFKWHFIIISVALLAIVLLTILASVFRIRGSEVILQVLLVLGVLVIIVAMFILLVVASKTGGDIEDNGEKIEKLSAELEKIQQLLGQVNQNTRLSETAKNIAFRDVDQQTLRDAVFDKLQQKDFEAASEIIDEIAHSTGYQSMAEQMRIQADKYRDATDVERMNQVIAHIEKHFEDHQWAKASAQIERLIRAYPNSEKAMVLRQKLSDKKDERKKVLLNAWDDAVKRQATDRSLEILRELDQYLTPNEGLALQEAARDVFRTKLHNLGVQFSLAVSGRQWAKALQTGEEITHDFPNSRMADEIREKIDILKQHAEQHTK